MNKHNNHFNFNIITEPFSNLDCCDPFCIPEPANKFSKKLLELEERINNLVFDKGAEYEAGQGVRFVVDNDKKVINVLINEELLEFKDNKIDLKIEELKKIFGESGGVVAASEWGKIEGDISKQQDLYQLLNNKADTSQLDGVSAEVAQLEEKVVNIANTTSNLNTSVNSLLDEVNKHKTSIKSLETFKTDTDETLIILLGKLESLEGTVEDLDLETINNTVEGLQSKVAEFKSKLEKHTTDIAELDTKISTHEDEAESKFSHINTELDNMIHDITQVYNIVEDLDLETINNILESIQVQMTAINDKVNGQNMKISSVESKTETNTSDISKLNGKVVGHTSDIVELQDAVTDHAADITSFKSEIATVMMNIETLDVKVKQTVSDLAALSKSIEGLDVDTIALTLQELQTQTDENSTKIESIVDNDIAQINVDIAQINNDISTLTTKINENKINVGEGLKKTGDVVGVNYNTTDFKVDDNVLSLKARSQQEQAVDLNNSMIIDFLALAFEKYLVSRGTLNYTVSNLNNFLIEAKFKFSRPYSKNAGLTGITDDLQLFLDITEEFSNSNILLKFRGFLSDTSTEVINHFFGRNNKFMMSTSYLEVVMPSVWYKYFDRIRMNKTYYIELGLDESLFE